MSPYKAIQVRLLRMSAERLSEKDKVHATISKDNPGIRWSMTFYKWNKWIYVKSLMNKGWTPTCTWIREEQKNWTISFKYFFFRSKKRCKLVEFTWFSVFIRVSSFLFSFRSESQSCEWNKLITPAISLPYSDVFSDFPEILRSRSHDLKLPSLPFGVVACAFATTSPPKRLQLFICFSFWLYLPWLLSVINGAVVHFTVVRLVAKPLNRGEATGDLVMIQTLLLFKCKLPCYHAN